MRSPRTSVERPKSWFLRAVGGKFGFLLGAMIALMLSTPLLGKGAFAHFMFSLFACAVLVGGLHAARSGRRALLFGLVLAFADLVIGRLVLLDGARWLIMLQAALWLSTMVFVTFMILGSIFDKQTVDVETLQAALCVYLFMGLIWLYFYVLVELIVPESFLFRNGPGLDWSDGPSRRAQFMRIFIFSYAKLTSSGDSDLTPATGFTTICSSLEALSGQVYLAVVIARLVGMYTSPQPGGTGGGDARP